MCATSCVCEHEDNSQFCESAVCVCVGVAMGGPVNVKGQVVSKWPIRFRMEDWLANYLCGKVEDQRLVKKILSKWLP